MLDRPLSSDADYFISCQVVPSWPNLCPSCQCHLSLCTKALFIFTSVPGPVESRTSEPEGGSLSFHRRVKAGSRNGWILTRAEVKRSTSQPRAPSGSLAVPSEGLGVPLARSIGRTWLLFSPEAFGCVARLDGRTECVGVDLVSRMDGRCH